MVNIAIQRKHSLAHLSEGWDDCYLSVKAASVGQVKAWGVQDIDNLPDTEAIDKLIDVLEPHVLSGKVMDTNEETNEQTLATFGKADVREVLLAFPVSELRNILDTCLGLEDATAKI